MPSSTRSNKDKHLLFSKDPVHLERTIRKDQRSTSLDAAAFTSTDSRTQPSTDIRPSSSTDLHRSTSIDTRPRTSIDHQSQNMVAIVILRQDENENLYDQDGHLRNATDDDFWQVVKHEKLGEGDFKVESSMSFGGSHWCRPMSMDTHRSTDHDEDQSTDYSKHRSTSSAESTAECMPSSTRSNKDKHLLFSEDPAHLERPIRKDQRFTSLDVAAFTSTDSRTQPSTDSRTQPSTDIRRSSSTDLHRSTSIDTTPRTSIGHQSRNMVAIVILRQDENGNLYDQDGLLRNATDDDFWQVVKHEKLGEGDFEVESSMSS
ncbi:hypothetical protein F2Q69_00006428 [Brassica cretica]|uniref:Uncharacterized protein n=1 Tax=Brassica cretica TaxID=69181 RepID=A0A8S9P0W7_BRACR|nr:hypothetical protein F2Q69_00006428 [Brassica cretica]